MKVRWTRDSVRFRISPAELDALINGEQVVEELRFSNDGKWRATLVCGDETQIAHHGGELRVSLAAADLERLVEPNNEGVYFQAKGEPSLRYLVEKDFPCAHPRAAETGETASEIFAPPAGFEAGEPSN